jgi:soluble lytic murein transglycosylase
MKTRSYFLLMLILLVATACNAVSKDDNDRPVVVVTATPNIIFPSATLPYVTPTTPFIPTPTVPPSIALTDAQQAVRNGDYVDAVQYFESVIDQPDSEPALQVAATYGLGEAALRQGLYSEAAAALTSFIQQYPDDTRIPQAHFLRGDAYQGMGDWARSIDDFNAYLQLRPGVIDSYAYERIGDAYLALGQPQESLDAYAHATGATREMASLFALRERVAAGSVNAGLPDQAIAQYDAILTEARNAPYRASIDYQAAQVLFNNSQWSEAYTRLERIVNEYPETPAAYQALQLLLQAEVQIDAYKHGLICYSNEDWACAVDAFNAYTSSTGNAPVDVLMMLGESYRSLGNTQAAITSYQTVLDYYPTDPAFGQAWLEQGRTLYWSGDTAGAIQRYTELATQHPDVAEASEALWRAGYLYSVIEDTENALATFDTLGRQFPGTEWAQEGLFMGATLAYNQGNTGRAAELFSQLAATGTGEYRAAAYLWVGRLYQLEAKDDLARQAYEAAASSDPGGYYSLRADDLLNGRDPFDPPANVNFQFDENAQLIEAEAWMRATFNITQQEALYPLGSTLENDPRMVRGRELMAVAAYEAAEIEFESLRQDYEADPLATYQLAITFRDLGLYKLSINAAATLLSNAGVNTVDAPAYIARLRFPTYYSDLVLPETAKYGLDPLLIFSLIRQESLFEGFATSYAAAQGLMQIIPDTGEWIAAQLAWPNYQNSDVYRPYINVLFGVYYLDWTLDQVDGQKYAALAGYNGGPSNAMEWLSISGNDIDMFIQTIPSPAYDETRTYVRRIYEQYAVYRALYGTP